MQKTKSSSSTTTTFQRTKRPSFQKRNSTQRRQGDLLEMHPCVLQDLPMTFQAFQPQDLPKALQLLQLLQRHSGHSSHSWPSSLSRQFYKFYNVPVSLGNPPHSSILRLECIFYIFYNFYSSIGFHRKLHRVPVEQFYKLYKHYILQRKGDVAISVKQDTILQNRIISPLRMAIHRLVLISDRFSLHCNSIQSTVSIVHLRAISSFLFYCCDCI